LKDSSAPSPGRKRSPDSKSFSPRGSSERPARRPNTGFSSPRPPRSDDRRDGASARPSFRKAEGAESKRDFSKPYERRGEGPRSEDRPRGPIESGSERKPYAGGSSERRSEGGSRDERPRRSFNSGEERKPYAGGSSERRSEGGSRDERPRRPFNSGEERKPYAGGSSERRSEGGSRDERPRRSFSSAPERKPYAGGSSDRRSEGGNRDDRPKRSFSPRPEGKSFSSNSGERRPSESRDQSRGRSESGDRRTGSPRGFSEGKRFDGPKNFGDRKPSDRFTPRDEPRKEGEPERKPGRKRIGQPEAPKKQWLGLQAPAQVKSFRYKQDAPSKGEAPDYDNKKIEKRPFKAKEKDKSESEYADLIRLNRYIAQAGLCSRREADVLIESGQITVNGVVVDQMGYNVKKDDVVKYGKRLLNREKLVYVLLNKPKDFLTTTEDPEDRKTVMNLVENACKERIYPVGRLDRNTTGLLLFTNDGELSEKLMHPSHNIKKIYQVDLDKPLTAADEAKIREGVELEDGLAPVDELEVLSKERDIVGLSIHLGRNRIVRRIFEELGYEVIRLDRVMYAGLTKKDLPRGNWRFLSEKEVINLKYFN